ncbi:N-formylglutamate amidohydrolase [Roseiterribacter gracilis]|uniref:N-formylglutamate amidohydrolase n=1 Tax=Roseiterribacter gracilis TaxID=2812848 RepID=A0A8S8XES9_9PROT|nr:N-formylglutamate amidohydrolase [Rhodospirillales bacterium TMPK1]
MLRASIPDFAGLPAFRIHAATAQSVPIVLASAHSGSAYGPAFLKSARVPLATLRQAEDAFVDRLFMPAATALGAPLLRATFPRAMVDANREPFELDPTMFVEALPSYVNTDSARVAAGLGVVPRIVGDGEEIYGAPLHFAEALARIDRLYLPYHAALTRLIERTVAQFGVCLLIDCHSMPSVVAGLPNDENALDFVLGDLHGASCDPRVSETALTTLTRAGLRAARNAPYAGGFVTRHYGQPANGVHVLQVEISRALYMNESTLEPNDGFDSLTGDLIELVGALSQLRLPKPVRPARVQVPGEIPAAWPAQARF